MKCVRLALGAVAATLIAMSSGIAADMALVTPPVLWTGFYCGGGGGGDWATFDIDNHIYEPGHVEHFGNGPPNSANDDAWNPVKAEAHGPFATAICGHDWQIGSNFVLGLFANVDFQNKHGKFENPHNWYSSPAYTFQGQRWDVGLGTMGTVGARAGVLVSPQVLAFGLAGWSWANASLGYFGGCEPSPPLANCGDIVGSSSKIVNGPTVGAGLEAMLGAHTSARLEYRYSWLGKMTTNSASVHGSPYPNWTGTTTANITDQSVRLMLVFRP